MNWRVKRAKGETINTVDLESHFQSQGVNCNGIHCELLQSTGLFNAFSLIRTPRSEYFMFFKETRHWSKRINGNKFTFSYTLGLVLSSIHVKLATSSRNAFLILSIISFSCEKTEEKYHGNWRKALKIVAEKESFILETEMFRRNINCLGIFQKHFEKAWVNIKVNIYVGGRIAMGISGTSKK